MKTSNENVRQYCPACYTLYYACPGCQCDICDCDNAGCTCISYDALSILNSYLEDYEIPEAVKEKQDE